MDHLLRSWELPELISIFQENQINDLEILGELIDSRLDFQELIRIPGIRLKLQKKFKQYIQKQGTVRVSKIGSLNQLSANDILFVDPNLDQCIEKSINVEDPFTVETEKKNRILNKDPFTVETEEENGILKSENVQFVQVENDPLLPSKKSKLYRVQDCDVQIAVKEHPLGPAILIYNEFAEVLNTHCQSYLCNIIITHCLKLYGFTLDNNDFAKLALEILELFPNECLETYYVAPVKKKNSRDDKSERSKGKLVDKYRNLKTFVREAENLQKSKGFKKIVAVNRQQNVALGSKKWLVDNRHPRNILKHWDLSYDLRVVDAEKQEFKVFANIFNEWPILKEPESHELIERDFLKKYNIPFENFSLKWNETLSQILKVNRKKLVLKHNTIIQLLEEDVVRDLDEDHKTYLQLQILSILIPTNSSKVVLPVEEGQKGRKTYWKPDSVDAREGIVIHVKIPGDIQNAVEMKKVKLLKFKQPIQPFIIIVGQDEANLNSFYICLDAVLYEIPSFLKALDILFKIFIIYNVRYAIESESISYFIQWAVYNIHTNVDAQLPSISNTINKLSKKLKKNN